MVKVTLEKPWVGSHDGSLVWSFGWTDTTPPYAPGRPGPYIPGKPRVFGPLLAGDPERNHAFVDEEIAKGVFGDWDAPQQEIQLRGWTKAEEKSRLALFWGDYRKPQHTRLGMGEFMPPMADVGAPQIPQVLIQKLDALMKIEPGFEYRPFEHFAFNGPYQSVASIRGTADNDRDSLKRELLAELREEMSRGKKVSA